MSILVGITVLDWSVSMMFDVSTLFADTTLGPCELAGKQWRAFELGSERAVWIALVVLAVFVALVAVLTRAAPWV